VRSRALFWVAMLLLVGAALAFRLPQLELRVVHGDEANQAAKAGMLFDEGVYRYDPHEHHGPTLYYAALPFLWLSGAANYCETQAATYRLVPLVFGVALILLLLPMRGALGPWAALWAGLFVALSHAMVFYSRYYVQEMLFVFFAFGAVVCGWGYWRTRRLPFAILAGLSLGLLHATKETCVLVYAAMAGALAVALLLARYRDGLRLDWKERIAPWHLALGALAGVAVSFVLFSSFFTHWRGPLDSILTYETYFNRAEGMGSAGIHDKPWHYYLHLLVHTYRTAGPRWSEGLIVLLAVLGILVSLLRRNPEATAETKRDSSIHLYRFLAVYAVLITAIYSAIPYKTPWNALTLLHALILMAGIGAASFVGWPRRWPLKALACILLAFGVWHQAHQSYLGNFVYAADPRNPYVYAHTSSAIKRLVNRVEEIAALHPDGHDMRIDILKPDGDYWPLPWYLRSYDRAGYWVQLPERFEAPFIIADTGLQSLLSEKLGSGYQVEFAALRPGVLLHAYIRQDLWDRFIASRTK